MSSSESQQQEQYVCGAAGCSYGFINDKATIQEHICCEHLGNYEPFHCKAAGCAVQASTRNQFDMHWMFEHDGPPVGFSHLFEFIKLCCYCFFFVFVAIAKF